MTKRQMDKLIGAGQPVKFQNAGEGFTGTPIMRCRNRVEIEYEFNGKVRLGVFAVDELDIDVR